MDASNVDSPPPIQDAMRSRRCILHDEGFSLVEVIVAMGVILVAVLGTLALIDRASAQTSGAKTRQTANALLRDVVETAQGVRYTQLSQATIATVLQTSGFPDADQSDAVWEIERNGITFTLTATACIVDDPSDGRSTHAAGAGFCPDSPGGTGDANGDDYRRVTLTAAPPAGFGTPVTQTTIVGSNRVTNPGGTGPGGGTATSNEVREVKITSPTLHSGQVAPCSNHLSCTFPAATSTAVAPKSLTLRATTAYTAQRVAFTVDGQVAATLSGPATTFSWTWELPDSQPDGNYVVAAQIYDATGTTAISSPTPLVVTINRYIPDHNAFAPTAAGRNPLWSNLPEIETYPTSDPNARVDRDVTGFLATRLVDGVAAGVACQTYSPAVRGCQDVSNPACCSASVTYQIAPTGANPDGSQQVGGATTPSPNVNAPNGRPAAPDFLTVTRNGRRVTLSWTNPAGSGDPDAGDCIDFFRVYRRDLNGTTWEYADRIERTTFGNAVAPCGGPGELSSSITLVEDSVSSKRYRVTSVDTHLAESTKEQVSG